MSRPIKFRVWDVLAKRMITDKQVPLAIALWTQTEPEDFKIMQFTGTTDINDRDVYEGDVVEFIHGDIFHEDKLIRGIVSFHDLTYWIDVAKGSRQMADLVENIPDETHAIRVIGNIYANPELMEGR